jgi:murein DD-endopeptidase MepM/ murein hydrolase activator NlpD
MRWAFTLLAVPAFAAGQDSAPPRRVVDLSVGEAAELELSDGTKARVKLLDLRETRDDLRSAVREARVTVEVNGEKATLVSGTYRLPVPVGGVQADCPVTGGYRENSGDDRWGLEKDARLRLWPAGSPWLPPATFDYPAAQRWFATHTWMANEPVDAAGFLKRKIYYHSGLDIGGFEGRVDVVAAADGVVVSAGKEALPGLEGTPARPRYDVVYVRDARDWYYRYSHLKSIDPAVRPGERVARGQKLGVLGKEGTSGGWSHLHFDITARQPSGKWGVEEGYAYLWEAYVRRHRPTVLAVARPRHLAWTGQEVLLDGSRSWSASGRGLRHEWTFGDGTRAEGPRARRAYDRPGTYSEILKVTDPDGNVGYDFAVVQVLDRARPEPLPPRVHAAYAPTFGIRPGDEVTFAVRTFETSEGEETWDFGDGTPPATTRSDGYAYTGGREHAADGYATRVHRFARPGDYVVRVERANAAGVKGVAHLHVRVEAGGDK